MTEETLSQANQIMQKIRDLETKLEIVNKDNSYCKKIIVRAKHSEMDHEFYIPDYINKEFTQQTVTLFKTALCNLRAELAEL